MTRVVLVALQFLVFLMVFALGSFLSPLHVRWFVTHVGPLTTRYFIADGLLLMLILYVVMLLAEALLKRLRTMGVWTSLALLLATFVGLIMKLGFVTKEI